MINNVQIVNFKSIHSLNLEMKPINILIGSNGAGKSNFISFFKLLKTIYDRRLQKYISDEGGAENVLFYGSKVSEDMGGQIEFNEINRYCFGLKPDRRNGFYFESDDFLIRDDNTPSLWIMTPSRFVNIEGERESYLSIISTETQSYAKEYMESFRVFHFHDTSRTSKLRKPAQLRDNEFLREDGSNLPAFLYWMQEKFPKEFKRIELTVQSVAPYFEKFNLGPDKLNKDQIYLRWKDKGSDDYFDATHLSDGTLRFIALTTLFLQPEAPEVILIDEPELGLHPFAINKLAGLIRKASVRTQIIISTQSVNLIDNFEPEDIITVDRDREIHQWRPSTFRRHNSEELKEWLNDYTIGDLWNKNVIGGRP